MDRWNRLLSLAAALALTGAPMAAYAQDVCILPGQVQASFASRSIDPVNGIQPNDVEYADFNHDGFLDLAVLNVADNTVDVMLGFGGIFVFSTGLSFDTARDLVVADFDHNGYDDIAVADEGVNDVVISFNSNVGFSLPSGVGAGLPGPTVLTEGDFDDDGNLDLAVATNGGLVFSLLGTGTGAFGVFSNIGVNPFFDMVAADINRDGVLDLVGTDPLMDFVFVATGRGNGSFDFPLFTIVGSSPESVIVDDFNKDGYPDAVSIDTASRTVSFLKGDGTAVFPTVVTFPAGAGVPHRVNKGDFDRDGDLDLLVSDDASNMYFVLENDGSANFLGPVPFTVDSENFDAAVADFDRDGRVDVAVTLSNAQGVETQLSNLGWPCVRPSFAWTSRFLDTGVSPVAITTADINDDARPDFVTANAGSSNFAWANGLGNGDFDPPIFRALANSAVTIAAADMNGDLDIDVVVGVQNPASHELVVYFNDGSGNLGTPATLPIMDAPVHLVLADLNYDNKNDIIVTLQSNDVVVGINDGTGTGFSGAAYPVGTSPGTVRVGDIDNDGLPDLAVAEMNMGTIEFFQNIGGGLFTAMGSFIPTALPRAFELVHFNGDGNLDIVAATGIGAGATIESFTGDGNFNFTNADAVLSQGTAGGPHSLAVADVDGDGNKDVLVTNIDRLRIDIALGNGLGGFSGTRFEMTEVPAAGLAVDDLDRDGTPDFVVTLGSSNQVQSFLNDGTGVFSPPFHPTPGGDARGSASGDFDQDGKLDLVVANFATDSVTFFTGAGGGTFAAGVDFSLPAGKGPTWLTVDDFDSDGDLDVVVSATSTGELVFLPWDGGGFDLPSSITSPLLGGEPPGMHRAADFNHDGIPDIAVISPTADRVQVLRGNGNGSFTFDGALSPGGRPTALQVGDFNRDGMTDIAVTQDTDDILVVYHLVQIFPQPPPASLGFTQAANPFVGADPRDFDVFDYDSNGFLDFAIPLTSGGVKIIRDATTNYSNAIGVLAVGVSSQALRAVDVNRDGFEDFVIADSGSQSLFAMRSDGLGGFPERIEMGVGVRAPRYLEKADFDMDGRDDLAVVPDSVLGGTPSGIATVFNTNCRTRLFTVLDEPSTCDIPPNPFAPQPQLRIVDDGANPIICELRDVTASLIGAASLLGTADAMPSFADVQWADLALAVPGGRGLRLRYTHAEARPKLSDSFTQAPLVDITGPLNLCVGDPAVYMATPDFENYTWTLDAPASPEPSMADTLDLTGLLGAGGHTLDVTAEQDKCFATDTETGIFVNANLSAVTVTPSGPFSICPLCTGPPLMTVVTGGGPLTYQWGYRTVSAGAITPIGGETGPSYTLQGPDFPAQGNYFVVVTVTPTCGAAMVSNEIMVDVTNAAAVTPVSAFTALSTDQQNFLEWAPPGGCSNVRIIRRPGGPFPTDPNNIVAPWELVGDFACSTDKAYFDAGLTNNTKYYYSAFAEYSGTYSERRSVTGRPFNDGPDGVLWAFSTGHTSMTQAGIRILGPGLSSVYVPTNDHRVYAVEGGAGGGQWLSGSTPFLMFGPSQAWPPTVNFPIAGTAAGAVYVSSQDGMLYVLDAEDLSFVRAETVGEPLLQAGPAGSFFSAPPAIMLGARNTVGPNVFRSFNPDTGGLQWTFDNTAPVGGDGSPIGIVLSAASIDVTNEIVYYGSHVGAGNYSLWAVDFSGGTGMLTDATNAGDLEASPIYLGGGTPAVVIGTKLGNVELREASSLATPIWSSPYNALDGGIKGFVLPHSHAGNRNFMFSTTSKLTSIRDNGPGTMPTVNWQVDGGSVPPVPNPSIPLFIFGTTRAYVGTSSGTVVQLDGIDTMTPSLSTPLVLGDGASAVGPPSFDVATRTIYVGTTEGVIYAIAYVP